MPFLESNILAVLRATGGVNDGMTADGLAHVVHQPLGRVRMTLRRMQEKGDIQITRGFGASARYLPTDMVAAKRSTASPPPSGRPSDPQLQRLQAEVQQLRTELSRARSDADRLRQVLRTRSPGGGTSPDALGPRLETLLQLCHPDRHDNSEKANEITRWLLSLRKRR